jgi:hypothetical protein
LPEGVVELELKHIRAAELDDHLDDACDVECGEGHLRRIAGMTRASLMPPRAACDHVNDERRAGAVHLNLHQPDINVSVPSARA